MKKRSQNAKNLHCFVSRNKIWSWTSLETLIIACKEVRVLSFCLWLYTDDLHSSPFLKGLTTTSGKFTTVCSGLNILTANIIFEGAAGTYSVGTVFNGKRSILGTVKLSKRGITTLNVYQAFFLPKGSNIYLTFTSDAGQISILSQSTWSMAYIGGTSSNIPEFASYLKTTVEQSSTSWNELTGLLRTSVTQTADGSDSGQTIQPSNLNLVNQQNLVMSEQTELYYAFVHLVYSGNATNIESMIAVSADKTTSTGLYLLVLRDSSALMF